MCKFFASGYDGEPTEIEEAKPLCPIDEIPFDVGGRSILVARNGDGKRFSARFVSDDKVMLSKHIDWLPESEATF